MSKLIGSKAFYKNTLKIALPILIQSTLTYLVGFVDNIMVGQIGTETMSGVAIANQLHFVFYCCLFGIVSGGSVLGVQFYGSGNLRSFAETFKFRMLIGLVLGAIAIVIFGFFGEDLIALFLHTHDEGISVSAALMEGKQYLTILLFGIFPFALTQIYSSVVKDMGETKIPMIASVAAILANTGLNYLLIFGKFGFPELGVTGAAIATVISRFLELCIILISIFRKKERFNSILGIWKSLRLDFDIAKQIAKKGLPLMFNEFLWSIGTVILLQFYSLRGVHVVAALNIATSLYNISTVVYMAIGGSTAIITGQLLGAGKMKEAKDANNKLFFLGVVGSIIFGGGLILIAESLPKIYNTSSEIHVLATQFIYVLALLLPVSCYTHIAFFTIRAGGKSLITFLYDSLLLWVVKIPLGYGLIHYTELSAVAVYLLCQSTEIIKLIAGIILIKKGIWLNTIVKPSAISVNFDTNE